VADVLSTFTGLVTLVDLDARDEIDVPALERYVKSMEAPGGGFQAAALIEGVDVEYTFYGLGSLALIQD
jgi:geranylgeranyl transferase type-2 subunit beta